MKLLIEGWRFPGLSEIPAVAGVRVIDPKVAVDLGAVQVLGSREIGLVPWVDFSVTW